MKTLKYLLLAGCALVAVSTEAKFKINNGEAELAPSYTSDIENLTDLKVMVKAHEINFTNANLKISGKISADNPDSKLIFGARLVCNFGFSIISSTPSCFLNSFS